MDALRRGFSRMNDLPPDELLLQTLGALLALFALWCLITWLVAQFNPRIALAIAPPMMRAALLAGLIIGAGSTAHAETSAADSVSGLALPERPITERLQTHRTAQKPGELGAVSKTLDSPKTSRTTPPSLSENTTTLPVHTVRSGDTLWAMARTQLGESASDRQVAVHVKNWHRLNRDVVGANPDLIHPGQQLKEPQL